MGVVYLCFDHQEDRPVALKTFRPEFLPDRAARARFLQEGETWVRLGKHTHIVQAYSVERVGDGREVYLVLELVTKEKSRRDASLRSWLTPSLPLPVDQALLIALQIVRGMQHATAVIPGFVHRDLKPENVLVGSDRLSNATVNRVRVTDFGLAKGLLTEQISEAAFEADWTNRPGRLTRAGSVLGTPAYMAPEQWERTDVDVRADIYALGCILGEMATGRLLVTGRTLEELRRAHQAGQALAAVQDVAPEVLRPVLIACLAAAPVQRYDDWATTEADLETAYGRAAGRKAPWSEGAAEFSRMERIATGWSDSAIGVSYLDLGHAEAALGHLERACQIGHTEGERRLEGAGLTHLGIAYLNLGDARRAVRYHEQALGIDRGMGDRCGEGVDLGNLGLAYSALGDAQRAITYHEQALAIHRESCSTSTQGSPEWVANRDGESTALGNLGLAYADLGDARQAIAFYEQALVIRRQVRDRRGEGNDLGNLGAAYCQLGDARRAIGYYEQALAIRREIGDRRGEGYALGGLGNAYLDLGDIRRAIENYERALVIRREIGDRRGESTVLGNLGSAYKGLGDARRAIGFYEQALAISQEIGDRGGGGRDLGNLGAAYADLGDAQQAIKYYEQALVIRREIGDRGGEGNVLGNLGSAYGQMGNAQRAIGYLEQALVVRRETGDRSGEGIDLCNLGIAHCLLGDDRRAIAYYEQALAISREIGNVNMIASVSFYMARLHAQQGYSGRALPLAREAARLWSQMGHRAYAQHAQQLVVLLERQGR